MQILCDQAGLRRFKIRASRALPNEYIELLFGVTQDDTCHILHFEKIPHTSTELSVDYSDAVLEQVTADTESRTGYDYLGSIHSHTDAGEPDPSPADNAGARESADEEPFFGIDAISTDRRGRRRHSVTFWPPQEPIELQVVPR